MTLLIADSFNRANSASTLGSTDGAGTLDPVAWNPQLGTWGITSNTAYNPSASAPGIATVETSHANIDISLTIGSVGGPGGTYYGSVFRLSDTSNYFYAVITPTQIVEIRKRVAGVASTLATLSPTFVNGDILRITAINNVITIYRNGTALYRLIDSFNRSATKCGIISNSLAANQMDNFSVSNIPVLLAEIATDSFNRVNNTSLGNTDGAGSLDPIAWQAALGVGVSDIVSNEATVGAGATGAIHPTGFTVVGNIDYINAGVSDVELYALLDNLGGASAGIVFRYVDDNNYWLYFANQATSTILYKRVGGTWTNVSGTLAGMVGNNACMSVRLSGSTIICEVSGVQVYSTADTALQTATKHGFMSGSNGGAGFGSINTIQIWEGAAVTPVITAIGPTEGIVAGGTNVTIVGNNFAAVTDVDFGGTPATSFTIVSDGYIEAVAPAHAAGLVDIVVSTASHSSSLGTTDQYTYNVPPPQVSSVTPNHGGLAGGTSVVVTGAYFTGATSVKFGTINAASFTVDNDGQITATSPSHASGTAAVIVTTPHGSNL